MITDLGVNLDMIDRIYKIFFDINFYHQVNPVKLIHSTVLTPYFRLKVGFSGHDASWRTVDEAVVVIW